MIEQLYYASGFFFFCLSSFIILKCYNLFFSYYKMDTLTLPTLDETPSASEVDKYRLRLVQARVKTEDDLHKMSEEDIKKLYLKHEQSVIDRVSVQVTNLFVKAYTKSVSKVIPIENSAEL